MKKIQTILALMFVTLTANAQSCPDNNHPHMIDLGLPSGTKWACCNVDAEHPEQQSPTNYGGYYAWGETAEKNNYNYSTYIHCDGSWSTCHNLGSDIAGTQYDVAHVKWSDSWVMPSLDQIIELLDNCTSIWTAQNGANGRVFTGPNGGSIFLPAAGSNWDVNHDFMGRIGNYWSSSQGPAGAFLACSLTFDSGYAYWSNHENRDEGQSVRPVSK